MGVSEDELSRKRTQVVPKTSAQPLRAVLVAIRQRVEVLLDCAPNLLPVELEIRALPLEKMSKPLPAALRAAPENLERLGPGVKREEDPLLDVTAVWLPFAVDNGQLIPSPTDVRHASPSLVWHSYHRVRLLCNCQLQNTTRSGRAEHPGARIPMASAGDAAAGAVPSRLQVEGREGCG